MELAQARLHGDAAEKRAEAVHTELKALGKTLETERDKRVELERALASSDAFRAGLRKNLDSITPTARGGDRRVRRIAPATR